MYCVTSFAHPAPRRSGSRRTSCICVAMSYCGGQTKLVAALRVRSLGRHAHRDHALQISRVLVGARRREARTERRSLLWDGTRRDLRVRVVDICDGSNRPPGLTGGQTRCVRRTHHTCSQWTVSHDGVHVRIRRVHAVGGSTAVISICANKSPLAYRISPESPGRTIHHVRLYPRAPRCPSPRPCAGRLLEGWATSK